MKTTLEDRAERRLRPTRGHPCPGWPPNACVPSTTTLAITGSWSRWPSGAGCGGQGRRRSARSWRSSSAARRLPTPAGARRRPRSTTASPSPQASQSCLTSLPSNAPAGGQLGSGSWQSVLTDVRGPFTVALFQNNGAYAACFTSSSFTEVTQVTAADSSTSNAQAENGTVRGLGSGGPPGGSIVAVGGTSSGDLQNVVQTHLSTTADGPYTLVDGRVASGVTAVTPRARQRAGRRGHRGGWLADRLVAGRRRGDFVPGHQWSGTSSEALQSADQGRARDRRHRRSRARAPPLQVLPTLPSRGRPTDQRPGALRGLGQAAATAVGSGHEVSTPPGAAAPA